jgi:hypothetical protein
METRTFRFGALSLIVAGVLFFASNLLTITLPIPPSSEAEFFPWLSENKLQIAVQNEILFFATLCLIPALLALYRLMKNQLTWSSLGGLGLLGTVIPVLEMLDIVEGRLVYPVYELGLSFDVHRLVLSLYHGGMHAVSLLLGGSMILIGLALRDITFMRSTAYLGLLAGVLQILGAYPWLTGFVFNLIVSLFFSVWFVLLGINLLSYSHRMDQQEQG